MNKLLSSSCGVVFSQTREDVTHETRLLDDLALARGRPLQVLCIASAGEGALAMADHPATGRVDAVDINPAQVQLAALKRAAAAGLDHDAQLAFLGATPASQTQRWALLERVLPHLDDEGRRFWTDHRGAIASGVLNIGVFERLLDELRQRLFAAGLDPLKNPGQALGHRGWQSAFAEVFDRARLSDVLGAAAVGYAATRSFASHFSLQFAAALRRFGSTRGASPILDHALRAADAPSLAPAHLHQGSTDLVASTKKLHFHVGDVRSKLGALSKRHGGYDLIQLSSVTDWLPLREVHDLFKQVTDALVVGGAMLVRSINGKTVLADAVRSHLSYDAPTSSEMQREDRAVFYREVAVGRLLPA